MSGKRRPPGRGRTPTYNRPAAVAQRQAAGASHGVRMASDKPVQVAGPQRRPPEASSFNPANAARADSMSSHAGNDLMRGLDMDGRGEDMQWARNARAATSKPKAPFLWRNKGKFALGGGAAVGGTAYLYRHNHRPKEQAMAKYYDPFSGGVIDFGKRERSTGGGAMRGAEVGAGVAAAASGTGALLQRNVNQKMAKLPYPQRARVVREVRRRGLNPRDGSITTRGLKVPLSAHLRGARNTIGAGALVGGLIGVKRHADSGVEKFASNAFVNQPVTLKSTGGGHSRVGTNQRGAQAVQVYRGKNLTLKTSSPLHHIHR